MSLSSKSMMTLMAYADGELEGADLEEAQRLLATDADAARFVAEVGSLGAILELGHEDRPQHGAKTIAAFDIADSVMAVVTDEAGKSSTKGTKPKVISLAAARAAKTGNGGLKMAGAVAAVLALAASLFLFAQHRSDEAPMAMGGPAVTATTPAVQAVVAPGTGVDVSTVNSPGNSVSVFYLPTANELSTSVVVWVDETGEK